MSPRPRADRDAKRAEFAAAAARVFVERGVANTSVSDIVKAAGVAQGTFYLYFDSKDDVVLAVVEQFVADHAAQIEAAVVRSGASAVDRLMSLRDVLGGFERDSSAVELADLLHRPENRALHDRLTEPLARRLAVVVQDIVSQGVDEGLFQVRDPKTSAWFVLGGLQSVERAGTPVSEMRQAIETVTGLALRALGYRGTIG